MPAVVTETTSGREASRRYNFHLSKLPALNQRHDHETWVPWSLVRLKYLNNYWMDYPKMFYIHSWFPEDESLWLSMQPPPAGLRGSSAINQRLRDEFAEHLVPTVMIPRRWANPLTSLLTCHVWECLYRVIRTCLGSEFVALTTL